MKFKWWKYLLIIVIFFILVFNYFFNYRLYSSNNQLNKTTDNSRIIGEKLNILSKYVKSSNYCENYIFIYHDSDCGGCIKSGYKLLSGINKKKYRILFLSDVKGKGEINNGILYKEENVDEILKKLFYIHTPAILKFDTNYTVLDVYSPGFQDERDFNEFIKR